MTIRLFLLLGLFYSLLNPLALAEVAESNIETVTLEENLTEEIEVPWKTFATVGGYQIILPPDLSSNWNEDITREGLIIKTETFMNEDTTEKTLFSVFTYYSVPEEPNSIKNYRYKYDFSSKESTNLFSKSYKTIFSNYFQWETRWKSSKLEKRDKESVLHLEGAALGSKGQIVLYHEHFAWSNPSTSDVFVISFIYEKEPKEMHDQIELILKNIVLPEK